MNMFAHSARYFLLLVTSVLLLTSGLSAQDENVPGALDLIAGKWILGAEMKPSGPRPGGNVTVREDCSWFEGRVAVVCNIASTTPGGKSTGLSVHTFNPQDRTYSYFAITSVGTTETSQGKMDGDTCVWNGLLSFRGHNTHTRLSIQRISPDRENLKLETVSADGTSSVLMEGIRRRQ